MTTAANVLIIVENLPVPFDRRVWMEATTLRRAGYEVTVVCPTGKGHEARYEVIDGIHIYRHPLPAEQGGAFGYLREYASALAWEFRLAWRARRERALDGFDIVHICNPPDLLFLVAAWHKLARGARVVFDHHDVTPELYVEKYGRRDLFYTVIRLAERLTFALADVVISTNDTYREVALGRGGMAAEDVFVVRSAPDLERFTRRAPNPSHRNGRRHLVGYVGVMGEQDGVDLLLHAIHEIVHHNHRHDIQFQIIGGGPSYPSLVRLASELDIQEYVEFTGFRSGEDLLERLSSCDIGVSPDPPTDYNHMCTMNKILEYMALGIPSVQFDLAEGRASAGSASVYAEEGDPSSLADAIVRLLDDPILRARMACIGRNRMSERLEWRHQESALLRAYDHALSE